MNDEQQIRAEAVEQATKVAIAQAHQRGTSVSVRMAELLTTADALADYITTGTHR